MLLFVNTVLGAVPFLLAPTPQDTVADGFERDAY